MTTGDEELVTRLRELAADAEHAADDNDGDIDERIARYGNRAADAITRLTREKAEARAQGAEEMREAAVKVCNTYEAEAREEANKCRERGLTSMQVGGKAIAAQHLAIMVRSLPLPSSPLSALWPTGSLNKMPRSPQR